MLTSETSAPAKPLAATVIEPPRGWQWIDLGELWRYRGLLQVLVWRDVKVRYKQTVIGAAWAILQPALMMIVFTIFFGRIAGLPTGGVPYPLFVLAGLLPWMFFSGAITSAANSVVGAERLVTKIYFPRLMIPFSTIGAAAVDFAVALSLLTGLMLWYGYVPGTGVLLAALVMGLVMLAATGIGTLLAALNVTYRDFRHVVPFMVQLWMFATPSIYMDVRHPEGGLSLLALNPLTPLIAAFRAALLGGDIDLLSLVPAAMASVTALVTGCFVFQRMERSFSDFI